MIVLIVFIVVLETGQFHVVLPFYVSKTQPRPQGSLLSCAGKIGTPGQSGFRTNSCWLLKDKSVTTGSPHNPQHGRTSENTD